MHLRTMASTRSTIVVFLTINLLLFTHTNAYGCGHCHRHPMPPKPPKTPKPCPTPGGGSSQGGGTCPIDTLKLAACANVLNGLLNIVIGTPPKTPCCSLIKGLADLEVALCLCTAIKANILGINLNIPVSLSALVNYCGRTVPRGFQCP